MSIQSNSLLFSTIFITHNIHKTKINILKKISKIIKTKNFKRDNFLSTNKFLFFLFNKIKKFNFIFKTFFHNLHAQVDIDLVQRVVVKKILELAQSTLIQILVNPIRINVVVLLAVAYEKLRNPVVQFQARKNDNQAIDIGIVVHYFFDEFQRAVRALDR